MTTQLECDRKIKRLWAAENYRIVGLGQVYLMHQYIITFHKDDCIREIHDLSA